VIETLATYSLVGVYSAMAVYTLAFLFYSVDLSTRAARPQVDVAHQAEGSVATTTEVRVRATFYQRAATAMMVIAWVVHLTATILRGIAGGRVPWANMFEFGLTATLLISAVFLVSLLWRDLSYLGAFVSGFVLLALGIVTVNYYVDVVPLPPALQSYWLVIHVFVASLATAFFALGSGLSIYQLIRSRVDRSGGEVPRLMASLPGAYTLEALAYRLYIIGFVLWTFTLIAGAVWAERAWGRYWGWDVKEVWTFIIWVIFAGYIHARATRGWRGDRAAWLGLIGFGALIFNYAIVNVFFTGLHSYSGL
jgi:cytochrome c-type biogenesis protein CcsB